MILFDLRCKKGHVFEAWFRDGAAYERQAKRGEINCPVCRNKRIAKAPMAPHLAARSDEEKAATARTMDETGKVIQALRAAREVVEKHCDHVGDRFPEEARKMHYGEAAKRNIYGEASEQEAKALREEGIEFGRIPWLPRHDA